MNAKQRRQARRQGKDIPYLDGFESHEARVAHQEALLAAKAKRHGWSRGKHKQPKLDPLEEAVAKGTIKDLLLSNEAVDDYTANIMADGFTDGYVDTNAQDGYDGYKS